MNLNDLFSQQVEAFFENLYASYQSVAGDFQEYVTVQLQKARDIAESITEVARTWDKCNQELARRGWCPLLFADWDLTYTDKPDDPASMNALETSFENFIEENLNIFVDYCATMTTLEDWAEHLHQAAAAHARREYLLAVPIWLIAMERFVSQSISGASAKPLRVFTSKFPFKQSQAIFGAAFSHKIEQDVIAEIAHELLRRLGRQSSELEPGEYTRHTILHGAFAGFGKRRISLQLVNLLVAIVALAVARLDSQIAEAGT